MKAIKYLFLFCLLMIILSLITIYFLYYTDSFATIIEKRIEDDILPKHPSTLSLKELAGYEADIVCFNRAPEKTNGKRPSGRYWLVDSGNIWYIALFSKDGKYDFIRMKENTLSINEKYYGRCLNGSDIHFELIKCEKSKYGCMKSIKGTADVY